MTIRSVLKSVAFAFLGSRLRVGLRIRKIGRSGRLTILNLHRVQAADGSSYRPLDPHLFDALLGFLRKNFTLLTFADLSEWRDREGVSPPLILSFDDGYRDFIEVTAPILARHRIRVNHNIIPACVQSGTPPLNVMIQDFIGKATPAELARLEIEGCPLDGTSSSREVLGFRASHYLKNRPEAEQQGFRAAVFDQIGEELLRYATPMMDLAAVKELSALHELGAHSYSHASLGFESDAYVSDDFQRCKAWFSEQLNVAVKVFAFPNGSYADHHIPLATTAGFEHILLVNDRFSNTGNCVHHRFGFTARTAGEMRYKAVGGLTEISD